jgi:hypothetical protein
MCLFCQATLARRAQRAASIRRGGAVAIAAGSASQLAHASSNGSSIDTAAGAAEQQQSQPLRQQGSAGLVGETVGVERSESAAAAAAAVAASWMSIRTGDSCPDSPVAGVYSPGAQQSCIMCLILKLAMCLTHVQLVNAIVSIHQSIVKGDAVFCCCS